MEKVIENVVYLHLIHMGYKVHVGQFRAGRWISSVPEPATGGMFRLHIS